MLTSMGLSVFVRKDFSKFNLVNANNVHHNSTGMDVNVQSIKDAYKGTNGVTNTTAA